MPADNAAGDLFSWIETQNYLTTAGLALVVYEYVITLHEEVDSIRHRGFGNTSLFFVFTRYTMLLGPFAQFMSQYLQMSCHSFQTATMLVQNFIIVQTAAFAALRAYALSNRNRYVLIIVLILGGLIPLITNVLSNVNVMAQHLPPGPPRIACRLRVILLVSRGSVTVNRIYTYLYTFCGAAAEIIVIFTTLTSTMQQIRVVQRAGMAHFPLTTCLVRNGCLYFVAILCVYILDAVCQAGYIPAIAQITLVAQYMPPLIANRFIMDLRRIDRVGSVSQMSQALPTLQFRDPTGLDSSLRTDLNSKDWTNHRMITTMAGITSEERR